MKKLISLLTINVMLLSSIAFVPVKVATAAGVSLDILAPLNASTSPNTATEVSMTWTLGGQSGQTNPDLLATSSKVHLKIRKALDNSMATGTISVCTASTTDFGNGAVDTGYEAAYGTGTSTFTMLKPSATTTPIVCIKVGSLDAGVYYISLYSEASAYDFLAAPLYVGTSNQVVVTADVEPIIGFTLSSNTCDLGILSNNTVSSCSYAATTTSNSGIESGIVVKIKAASSSDLTSVNGGIIAASSSCAQIATSTENGSTGIRLSGTSTPDWLGATNFACAADQGIAVPTSTFAVLLTSSDDWTGGVGTFTMEHLATAGTLTKAGTDRKSVV